MKKSIQLIMILLIIGFAITGCKSKQKTVEIPAAQIEARKNATQPKEQVSSPQTTTTAPAATAQPEQVRDEKFNLDSDEKNLDALNQKYHVVVGSFKNRDNAKGLQKTLSAQGENAIIVINEHGMYRVIIGSYGAYSEARNKISKINAKFADAWVLVQKK